MAIPKVASATATQRVELNAAPMPEKSLPTRRYDERSWQRLGDRFDNNYSLDFPWRECVIQRLLNYDGEIDSVLDVACCVGWYIGRLRRRGFRARYQGIDITPNFVERARRANPEEVFEVGDARHLKWAADAFDLVFAGGVLMHLDPADLPRTMNELFRVARQSVFIYTYGDTRRDRVEYDVRYKFFNVYYTLDSLKRCVPDGWAVSDRAYRDDRHFIEFSRTRRVLDSAGP
jgi:ubiquinone/menaquinone biosynthesis C-methylase UbiE